MTKSTKVKTNSKPGKSWAEKMKKNDSKVKKLETDFADLKAGTSMYISNPETIAAYIHSIPKGKSVDLKTLRKDLALQNSADGTCPVIN
jgi:hypothetical protein